MKDLNLRKVLISTISILAISASLFAQGASENKTNVTTLKMEQFSGTNSNDSGPALDEMIGEFEKENNF
jgi:septal ring-binding cell division protein DamX